MRVPLLIGFLCLSLTAAHAAAPKWVSLVTKGGAMAFVDKGSITHATGIDKGDVTASTLVVLFPGDNTSSGPMAYLVQKNYYNCVQHNTTVLRTQMYDIAGKLLGEARGNGESHPADSDAIFGGTFNRLCSKPLAVPGHIFVSTDTAVGFARTELAKLNPGNLAVSATAQAKVTDIDLSGLTDSASIALTPRPKHFYLYTLYRSQAGRLVFYGQDKTNNVFTVQFRQPGVAQPLAILPQNDFAGIRAKVEELGLTEIQPYDRVWFEGGASFSMAPNKFWTERCHHPYEAVFRVNLLDGTTNDWMIFKKWPKTATTIAYCDPRTPAHVTYGYDNFEFEIYQFSPGRIYLKFPGEPTLVRFNADGKTSFPRNRDDIIFVPASRIESVFKNATDNGPSQQAAMTAADAVIQQLGAMQLTAR